ncbi:MAG: hypothetical protein R3F49_15005 [Planctomycetota bacterium]
MDYQPRTIALVAELLHPPVGNDPRPIQRLHNELFEAGQPAYAGFQVTPLGPVLSNPMSLPGAVSQVAFMPDRVQFREERSSLTYETFAERVRAVAQRSAELRQVPLFVAQTVVIRSLVNPRTATDTRAFLRDKMFGIGDALGVLGHPADLVGLRLALGPAPRGPQADSADGDGDAATTAGASFSLRIESWQEDPRSLFIELAGTFGPVPLAFGGPQADPDGSAYGGPAHRGAAAAIEANVLGTYRYLERSVLPFLARFDRRSEPRPDPRNPEERSDG